MSTRFFLFLAAVLTCVPGSADEKATDQVQLTFEMHSPELSTDSQVFITGNVAAFGNWNPAATRMKLTAEHTWVFRLSVPRGTKLEYKYTLGDWSKEGARDDGRPLANFKLIAAGSATLKNRIHAWTSSQPRMVSGQVTGQVRYHRQIESHGLRPRDIVVWLPPSYASEQDRNYPVIYMHDGQNLFDPKTSAFGVDWQVDETVTQLIQTRQIAPLIVVGIYNTPDRSSEYVEGDQGNRYRDFVVNELKPIIDADYRTQPEREHTFVGGSSAGGLCAFIMAWEHADTFAGALCMSPAFRFQRADGTVPIDYVSDVLASSVPDQSLRLYIDNGGRGVDEQLMPGVDAMAKALHSKGFADNENLRVVIAPQDPHNESAWARRLPIALKWLLD